MSAAEERVHFVDEAEVRALAADAFDEHRRRILAILPEADVQHVGSTAVPGSLTKGDLDIQVRVKAEHFPEADVALARHYERNVASTHSATFSSFKDDEAEPPLGIQLTVAGGPEDFFVRLRDFLIATPEINERYNELKRKFEGATMEEYRAAKSAFVEEMLQRAQP
jgi:GrpB-like predicted nucleotidyltransferase (UPF0157 family)